MNKEDFQKWFMENLEVMTRHGVYHYNTDKAELIHLLLDVFLPLLDKPAKKRSRTKNG